MSRLSKKILIDRYNGKSSSTEENGCPHIEVPTITPSLSLEELHRRLVGGAKYNIPASFINPATSSIGIFPRAVELPEASPLFAPSFDQAVARLRAEGRVASNIKRFVSAQCVQNHCIQK